MALNVGTELRKILESLPLKIAQMPECACRDMEAKMNGMGPAWCESRDGMREIVCQLKKSAAQRGLPFLDMAGRVLVRRAISNARKEQARATQASSACGSLPHEHGWPAPPKSAVD